MSVNLADFNSVTLRRTILADLPESEWKADPQQAPRAEQYNTRKTIKQTRQDCVMNRRSSARRMISA